MAKVVWRSLVLVLAVASSTAALKCFSCDNCLVQPATMLQCPTEHHYCRIKKVDRSVIWKGCSLYEECDAIKEGSLMEKRSLKEKRGIFDILKDKAKDKAVDFAVDRIKDIIQGNNHPEHTLTWLPAKETFTPPPAEDTLTWPPAGDSSDEGFINVNCCSTDYCNLYNYIYVPVQSLVPDDHNTDVPNRVSVPDSTPVPDRNPMPSLSDVLLIECYNNGSCKMQRNATSSKVQSNEDFNMVQSNATSSKVQSNEDFNIVQNNATSSKVQSNEDFNIVQNNATSDIFLNHATCSKMTKLLVLVLLFALYLLCC